MLQEEGRERGRGLEEGGGELREKEGIKREEGRGKGAESDEEENEG